MHNLQELKTFLQQARKVVITTHRNPDGDAMGSSLALYNLLIQQGHDLQVITPTDYPEFLTWLPGNDHVLVYTNDEEKCQKLIKEADIIFCLDFNSLTRVNEVGHWINVAEGKKVMVDHHPSPDDFADYVLHDDKASSTCELIYDLMEMLDMKELLNKEVGECLYTGIMTDTGSFRFSSTSPKVHRIAAELLEKGVNNSDIYNKIDNTFTEARLRFFGHCLENRLKVLPEHNTAYIYVTKQDLQRYHYKTGDSEGLVNYTLALLGIEFGALIIDRTEVIKLSFRSKGNFNVNQFAREHFSGGGHAAAAGGISNDTLEKTVEKFVKLLPKYKIGN